MSAKQPPFTIDDELPSQHDIPPSVQRFISCMEKLPVGSLITTKNIPALLGITSFGVEKLQVHPALAPNRYRRQNNHLLWGSAETIAAYRKHIEEGG